VGLDISRSLLPGTIRGFLDFTGRWDPALGIMFGAGCVTYFLFNLTARRTRPVLAQRFTLPVPKPIDTRLILGATLFGLGWGTAGICVGPAIIGALWNASVLVFTLALLGGVAIYEIASGWRIPRRRSNAFQSNG
jgi:uncharacterized membrane protein YedE/YeeE